MVFEELDTFQDFITLPSQPGQLTDEDGLDMVVQTEGEGFLEEGSVLVGLSTRDMVFKGLDDFDMVSVSIVLEVFHLSGCVLSSFK